MESTAVLSIDCGTQSVRAMIFNEKGDLVCKVKRPLTPYESPQPGWAEQDPDLYWNELCKAVKQLKTAYPQPFDQIEALTLTTQRDTAVFTDQSGRPLRPAVIWMDQRKLEHHLPFNKTQSLGLQVTGMKETAINFSRNCPAHWVMVHEPNIWEKTAYVLLLSGYLIFRLTGKFMDSDAAQAGKVPFNHKKRQWEPSFSIKGQIFQIPKEKLPDLVRPGESLGKITEQASAATGIPSQMSLIASASDKACETIGSGCRNDKTASISLGSQASIQTTTKKYFEPIRFIPPFAAMIPGTYNPEIQVYKGYWMISWFRQEFAKSEDLEAAQLGIAPEVLLNQRLDQIPAGSDGLVLQPLWGAGLKRPEARGAIIGFSDIHTRIHIYRAIIEGIGYALLEGADQIEKKTGHPFEAFAISGGGSQSDAICQISANLFNRPVYRVQTYETSGLGAAIAAFVGLGIYENFDAAIDAMVHPKDWFQPDPKEASIYQKLYSQIYLKLYRQIKPLYKDLQKIIREDSHE